MKLSTLNSKMKLCAVGSNTKLSKGDSDSILTLSLSLAPATMAGRGDVCAFKSKSCEQFCLGPFSGRGVFDTVKNARVRKTQLFFDDNSSFKQQLYNDIQMFNDYCIANKIQGYARLNIASDINWMKIKYKDKNNKSIFDLFPDIKFYDYTKDLKRTSKHPNYKLTYSYSENVTTVTVKQLINKGKNVAVIFDKLPTQNWLGMEVIDGDETDLRFEDKSGVIVGLSPKGNLLKKAVKNNTDGGFVIRNNINVVNI